MNETEYAPGFPEPEAVILRRALAVIQGHLEEIDNGPTMHRDYLVHVWAALDAANTAQMTDQDPHPGQSATLCFPGDKYPYTVVAVSAGGKVITVREDSITYTGGDHYAGDCIYDYGFRGDDAHLDRKAHLREGGSYYLGGIPLVLGHRRYYRDPTI